MSNLIDAAFESSKDEQKSNFGKSNGCITLSQCLKLLKNPRTQLIKKLANELTMPHYPISPLGYKGPITSQIIV